MRIGTQSDEIKTAEINTALKKDEELAVRAGLVSDASAALDRINSGVTVTDVRTKRTDFDADLTEEEKAEALRIAKEAEMKKIEKEAKSAERAVESEIFIKTKGFAILAYILYFFTYIFDFVVYLVSPLCMLKYVSSFFKCSKLGSNDPLPRVFAKKLILMHENKKARNKAAKATKSKTDDVISFFLSAFGLILRIGVIYMFLAGLMLVCFLGAVSIPIILILLISAVNAVVGIDVKLLKSSKTFKGQADEYRQEMKADIDNERKTAQISAEEKDVEGMTEKEKMSYLKSTGKIEMQETAEHHNQYNNYY